MGSLSIFIITIVVYVSFGTVVNIVLATNRSSKLLRTKTKVCFHTFVAPVMLISGMLLVMQTGNKTFYIFLGIVFISTNLIRTLLSEHKYLTDFIIHDNKIEIQYLTSLLQSKNYSCQLTDLTNIEIAKANWLIDYPATVNIKGKDEWTKFELIDKKIRSAIQKEVNAASQLIGESFSPSSS